MLPRASAELSPAGDRVQTFFSTVTIRPRPPATRNMSTRRPHPHFDDRGSLDWFTTWNEAASKAREEKKLVFVEVGREL